MALEKVAKVFRSIDEIGRDSINSIADDDAFFTYEWFKTLETQRSFSVSPYYIAVYDEDKLVAFTSCFIDLNDTYFHVAPHLRLVMPFLQKTLLLGQQYGFCQRHILACYSLSCGRTKIIQKKNPDEKLVLNLLANKIDAICKKERVLYSSFLFVSEFDELLMKNLQHLGYIKYPGSTNFYLDVRWSSFEEYLKSLKKNYRHNIRKQIRKCDESGVTIEEQEVKYSSPTQLSELLQNLNLKYNKDAKNVFDPSFFRTLNEYAGEKLKLFIAKKNNDVVGFSLLFRQGDTVDSWMGGFKYDALTRTDFVYFNVVYYMPIQWAIEEGIKKIYFRNKADRVKLARGCKPEETFAFLKCHDVVLGPLVNNALRNPFWSYLSRRLPS